MKETTSSCQEAKDKLKCSRQGNFAWLPSSPWTVLDQVINSFVSPFVQLRGTRRLWCNYHKQVESKLSNWSDHFKSTMDACVASCRRGWCYCCFFCCQDDDADGQQTKEQTCAPFRSKENIYYSRQKVEEAKKNDSAQDGQCDAR